MRVFRLFRTIVVIAPAMVLALPAPLLAKSPTLPKKAPVPQMNRADAQPVAPPADAVPVPEKRPADAPDAAKEPPPTAPVPPEKPSEADKGGADEGRDAGKPDEKSNPVGADKSPEDTKPQEKKAPQPDPRSSMTAADAMPAEESACRARLKALGVVFEDHKAEHDAAVGCSIPYPVVVKKLGASLDIAPEAELNCPMAEALAKFMKGTVTPAAKAVFGAEPKSIAQASAFVCRPRHNGGKMSEHAFGNALDIASFTLTDGTRIEIGPTPPDKQAKFLDTVRAAACGPFKTVLGPGSDPDHELHFHLDLEPRRHNGTFCQ
jgi:hypothetical protein